MTDIETIEERLAYIFDTAQCAEDTLWYSNFETFFDCIMTMIEDEITD